jgi:serine/threonine protein kinase
MTTPEDIRQRLVDSHLASSEEADAYLTQWRQQAAQVDSAEVFLQWLVDREWLTNFQAEALLAGHSGPFLLGPYEVQEHLARGQLGGLFSAIHQELGQRVSLKVFSGTVGKDPEQLARVGREIRILIELDHPNVVRSFQAGRVGGTHYLAMEELRGETLRQAVLRAGRLPLKEACRIAHDLARGLAHLHEMQVVHRDLRPDAVWVTDDGVPKIFEFTGARDALSFVDAFLDRELTPAESVTGDYTYKSPEQSEDPRNADARSDIYALGCVFFECLTGSPPFSGSNPIKLVLRHATEPHTPPSELIDDLPPQIDETISGMLAKRPEDRFQTAKEVAFALEPFIEKVSESVCVVPVSEAYLAWARKQHPKKQDVIPPDAVAITPKLAEFLSWVGKKQVRHK